MASFYTQSRFTRPAFPCAVAAHIHRAKPRSSSTIPKLSSSQICSKEATSSCAAMVVAEHKQRQHSYKLEGNTKQEHAIISRALQRGRTEQAWNALCQLKLLPQSPFILNQMLLALADKATPAGLSKAQNFLRRIQSENLISLVGSSALARLAIFSANNGLPVYAESIIRLMIDQGYHPHVKVWSTVVWQLGKLLPHGNLALRLFNDICKLVLLSNSSTDAQDSLDSHNSNSQVVNGTNISVNSPAFCPNTHQSENRLTSQMDDDGKILRSWDIVNSSSTTTSTSSELNKDVISYARPDTVAFNAALNACAVAGDTCRAEEVLEKMKHFEVKPDALTFNVLIKLYARLERKDLIAGALQNMLRQGIAPGISTFYSLVAAYVGLGDVNRAEKLVQAMRQGRRDICRVLKGSGDDDQSLLLPRIYRPDTRIYTTLMKGYVNSGRLKDVIETMKMMQNSGGSDAQPDHVTYTTAVSAFVDMGSMEEAWTLAREIIAQGIPLTLFTYNILLKGYCRAQDMQKARMLLEEMKAAGVAPDAVSYNTLIDGCVHGDDNVGALGYFEEMQMAGIAPSAVTCTTLMKAFARNGQPKHASKVFQQMQKDVLMKVDVATWNMLLESYCKVGMVEAAKAILQQMKEHKFYPNVKTYGSIAKCFNMARRPSDALRLWDEIKNRKDLKFRIGGMEPIVPDRGLLDTLLEIFVRAAHFVNALEVIACMDELKITPNKTKYKRLFMQYHSLMFTTKYRKLRKFNKRYKKRQEGEAFKLWLGLPNDYHNL